MRLSFILAGACIVAGAIAALSASASAQPSDDAFVVGCTGTFGPQATAESLSATFGAQNVDTVRVGYESTGDERRETILFPWSGQSAEIRVVWASNDVQSRPVRVTVYGGNLDFATRRKASPRVWRSTAGLRAMMTIAELEALNGRPFTIARDSMRGYATVESWNGGRLARDGENCWIGATLIFFDAPKEPAWDSARCPLCPQASSSDAKVRGYSGHVYSFTVTRDAATGR